MKIERIRSHNLPDALSEARRRLGAQVTVLHTRQCDDPAWFGLGRKRCVEILVAVDTPAVSGRSRSLVSTALPVTEVHQVRRELSEIREILARLDGREAAAEQLPSPIVERLVRNGVPEKLAEAMLAESGSTKDLDGILKMLTCRIRCSGPIAFDNGQARVALVGPTGTGKTTTAAKLAAQYSLIHKKSVALLTLDTYRVGAVEQLMTYARILGIPMEVALCPEDVHALIAKHRDKELIIIDTVGRSQRKKEHLAELARFIRPADPTEVHLVTSASGSPDARKEAVDAFGSLSVGRLILTKLDECPLTGCIVDLAVTSLLPFSYVTFGQEVPDDIVVADPKRLSRLVWEGAA